MQSIKADFPILKTKINGKSLVYLDSAATSQKCSAVIEAEKEFYETINANVARTVHTLGERATKAYEDARKKVADFIGAEPEEIIFTRNATEAINLVANCLSGELKSGDEILTTVMEHHSNIVPWQLVAEKTGAKVRYAEILPDGTLHKELMWHMMNNRTKLVTITHVSNVLGTINPVKDIVKAANEFGALTLIDAAQSVPHMPINVKELDCDFLAFSGHKMLGPTGIGVLYGKREILEQMPPFLGGGEMIREVTLEKTTYNDLPHKFEAGTPNIAGAVALGAAVDYLRNLDMKKVHKHEQELTEYALTRLKEIPQLEIYGPTDVEIRGSVVSFNVKGIHPHDVAQILDSEGIAIRSGHACAMPLMNKLGVESVCRASFYIYNTKEDVDALVKGLLKVKAVMKL
ncbi:MAG TPA: cysteine desulfurase [Candidatus Nanoarchaeia archaeon]|nr:cysteine desulfurase [Candidatus Nanoarchaeia archaeon]